MTADLDALSDLRDFLRGEYGAALAAGADLDPVDSWVSASVPSVLARFMAGDEVFEARFPSGRTLILHEASLTAAEVLRAYKRRAQAVQS
jgi:hypothetical protein